MIARAQDYQLVTPAGVIDGGILPARDVAADGSAHALRTEDMCFAIEAVKERNFYNHYSSSFPSPSHILRAADWEMVWYILRNLSFRAGSFDRDFPRAVSYEEPFYEIPFRQYTGSLPTELSAHYPNAYAESCFGSVANHGHVLDETSMWRGFYYDLLRADRIQVGQSYNGSYTRVNSYGSAATYQVSNEANSPTGANTIIQEIAYDQNGSETGERVRSAQFGVTSANIATSVPLPAVVNGAKIVALYDLWVQPLAGYHPGTDYYFTRTYSVPFSGGVVSVPTDCLLLQQSFDLVSVCANLGHALPPSIIKTSSWNNTGAFVRWVRSFLVLDYDFRTEIRSLNWQWTP